MAQHEVVHAVLAAVVVLLSVHSIRRVLLLRVRARVSGIPVPTSTTVASGPPRSLRSPGWA